MTPYSTFQEHLIFELPNEVPFYDHREMALNYNDYVPKTKCIMVYVKVENKDIKKQN